MRGVTNAGSKRGDQVAVDFDRDDAVNRRGKLNGEAATSGTDLEHGVIGAELREFNDAAEDRPVG